MKKQAFYILAALTVMATAAISQAYGQWVYASKFDVPFDFTVSGQRFPAGSYIVERGPHVRDDQKGPGGCLCDFRDCAEPHTSCARTITTGLRQARGPLPTAKHVDRRAGNGQRGAQGQ